MKEYKRLTERKEDGYIKILCNDCEYAIKDKCGVYEPHYCTRAVKERLAELEEKIENGTLIPVESLNEQGYYKSEDLGWNNPIWIVLIMSMLSGNIDVSKLPPDVQDELNKLKELQEKDNEA